MGIHANHQVNDLIGSDLAEPVRRVRRNDDHVTGAKLAADSAVTAPPPVLGPFNTLTTWLSAGVSLASAMVPPVTESHCLRSRDRPR